MNNLVSYLKSCKIFIIAAYFRYSYYDMIVFIRKIYIWLIVCGYFNTVYNKICIPLSI